MIIVSDAQKQILDSLSPLNNETVKIEHSLNRILAEPVIADQPSPSFDNSSMDGIAVITKDIKNASPENPIALKLVGTIPAGDVSTNTIKPGQAMQIMTGAKMPTGADCVVQVEHTNLDFSKPSYPDQVLVFQPAERGTNIRKCGDFYHKDETLISPGQKIRPQDIALLAMTGMPVVKVVCKPKIGLLTTGDELVPPGEPILPGKIRDTNSYMLAALLENNGADIIPSGIIPDDEEAVIFALQELKNSGVDLILTSGGVSVGAYDIVRRVIENHGQLKLWRVNMRPGKPLTFGEYKGIPFIGLPGNPVSAFVGFHVFVRPALQKMMTNKFVPFTFQKAKLMEAVSSDGRETYIPATLTSLNSETVVQPAFNQSSGNLYALIPGNSLIILSLGVKFLNKGELVDVVKLDTG
jgi:molybdopterin molybdotransferase